MRESRLCVVGVTCMVAAERTMSNIESRCNQLKLGHPRLSSGSAFLQLMLAGHDASETKVVRTGVDFTFAPCAHYVPGAILIGAQIRSASMRFFGLVRLGRVKRRVRALRVSRDAAHQSELLVVVRAVPIARPLPHISSHVTQAIRIRRVMCHRRNSDESIFTGVRIRKVALVRVRHPFALRPKFLPPYKWLAGLAAARSKFPLRLSGQALTCLFGVSYRVVIGDVDNRIIFLV